MSAKSLFVYDLVMNERHQVSDGEFELPVSAAAAMELFTPEGERDWVPGWDPRYPAGQPSEERGTVFRTVAHGVTSIWLILELDRSRRRAEYARVTPGVHAGTVSVACEDTEPERCRVSVRYDLTTLGTPDVLEPYRPEPFAEMMETWAAMTTDYLTSA